MISIEDNLTINNSCSNNLKRKFSVEKLLETKRDEPTIKRLKTSCNNNSNKSLKFGVESFILKDSNDLRTKFVGNCDVVPSHSPNPNSLLTSSRSPSQTEGLTYSYTSYIQPPYLCTSSSCDGYLLSKPLVSYESCYHPMINMNTTTYAQQMMAHISELANKNITEAIYTTSNSNINLLQHNYNSHYTPSNVRNGDQSANHAGKRKRSWSRAVFSNLQRKGLEKRFEIQKYITKPDRRQLAATLGLTDAQVKVWFQNRRMKWRHSKEYREDLSKTNANKEQHSHSSTKEPLLKSKETNES